MEAGTDAPIRVLVVDDHPVLRESLAEMVAIFAQVVGLAENGEEAVKLAEELQPDLILMDIKMPVMDGITATLIIKDRWPGIRVVAHTAFSDKPLIDQMMAAGADAYVLKGGDLTDEIIGAR